MFELNENIYCRSSGRSHCQGWASISPRGPSRSGTCSGGRESPGPTGGPDCPAQGLLILCRRCVTLCDGKSDKHQRKGNWCHCFYHQAGQTAPDNAAGLTERHYVDKRLNFPRTSLRISCLRPASHKDWPTSGPSWQGLGSPPRDQNQLQVEEERTQFRGRFETP